MRFIESVRLQDGVLRALPLHQARLDIALLAHYGKAVRIDLARELAHRALPATGLFKIRITYSRTIEAIDIEPYVQRTVERVALVAADSLDYRYKYADRTSLDALRSCVPHSVQPILTRGGLVTDALYANVCLFDTLARANGGLPVSSAWVTPAAPLLAGTARAAALAAGEVHAQPVLAVDFHSGRYTKLKFINCMVSFAEANEIVL